MSEVDLVSLVKSVQDIFYRPERNIVERSFERQSSETGVEESGTEYHRNSEHVGDALNSENSTTQDL